MRPILRITLIAAAGAAFMAVINTSTIYLSMMSHGHSLLRMFAWQLGAWSPWALAAPWIVRNSARLRVFQLVPLGIGMFFVQWIVLALLYVGLQPFKPVTTYSFGSAMSSSWSTLIMVSALAFGL